MAKNKYAVDFDNTQTRVPVVIVADYSGSMEGEPEKQVNTGIYNLITSLQNDPIASQAVSLSIIQFESNYRVSLEFSEINTLNAINVVENLRKADGGTNMAAPIKAGLDSLQDLNKLYKSYGLTTYKPFLIIMSDGEPHDRQAVFDIGEKIQEEERNGKLISLSLAVDKANLEIMNALSINKAMSISSNNLIDFFKLISTSISTQSSSGSITPEALKATLSTVADAWGAL